MSEHETPAETIRRAIEQMRERATHPDMSPSPWVASPHGDIHDDGALWVADTQSGDTAAHIASWHPAAALATADLLEHVADDIDFAESEDDRYLTTAERAALRLARTYLGETP